MTPLQLRPTGIADLLDGAFSLYRRNALQLLALSGLVLLPLALLRLILVATSDSEPILDGAQNLLALPLLTGALTAAGVRMYANEPVRQRDLLREAWRRYFSVLAAALLQGIVMGLPVAVIAGCVLTLAIGSGSGGSLLAWVVLTIFVLPFMLFLGTKYAIVYPALIIEGVGASTAMSRSWRLTASHFWYAAGTLVATSLLTIVLSELPALGVAQLAVTMTPGADAPWFMAAQVVLSQLGLLIVLPLQNIVAVLLYYDLRVRSEAPDLEAAASALVAEQTQP
jgi:hypothetical protein